MFVIAAVAAQQYEFESGPPARAAPARIQSGYSGPAAPKPTPVAILKQINRYAGSCSCHKISSYFRFKAI